MDAFSARNVSSSQAEASHDEGRRGAARPAPEQAREAHDAPAPEIVVVPVPVPVPVPLGGVRTRALGLVGDRLGDAHDASLVGESRRGGRDRGGPAGVRGRGHGRPSHLSSSHSCVASSPSVFPAASSSSFAAGPQHHAATAPSSCTARRTGGRFRAASAGRKSSAATGLAPWKLRWLEGTVVVEVVVEVVVVAAGGARRGVEGRVVVGRVVARRERVHVRAVRHRERDVARGDRDASQGLGAFRGEELGEMRRVRVVRVRRPVHGAKREDHRARGRARGWATTSGGGPPTDPDRPRRGTSPARARASEQEESANSAPEPRG